jgi:uncharacterized membrane protein YhaH (DUF805 family)
MNWLIRPWRHAFDFSGRSPRREWAIFLAVYYGVFFLLVAVAGAFGPNAENVFGVAALLWVIACIIPALSLGVRRLHDHGKSGWLLLISAVPFLGWIFYLIMMLTTGDGDANEYGPDPRFDEPLADGTAEIFA